jgi:hypothetical protein
MREVTSASPIPIRYTLRDNNDVGISGINPTNSLIVFLTSFNRQWSLNSGCNSSPSNPFELRSRIVNVFGSTITCGDPILAFKGNISWQLVVNLWLGSLAIAGALLAINIVMRKKKVRASSTSYLDIKLQCKKISQKSRVNVGSGLPTNSSRCRESLGPTISSLT